MSDFKQHLGDGLYASYDGYHIVLEADRDGMRHWVALDPEVFKSLIDYEDDLSNKIVQFNMSEAADE